MPDVATKEPATVGEIIDQLPAPRGAVPMAAPVTPMQLLERAIDRGVSVEQITGLMALQERWEVIERGRRADEAKSAFVAAMADFKANPPTIVKDKAATFDKGANARPAYMFASLAQVAAVIGAALGAHGLSHRWHTEQIEGRVRVTCTVTHIGGHSESTALEAAPDASGSKNPIQAIGSTTAYLEKYTLCALTGLAAGDQDDEGAGSGGQRGPTGAISAEQKEKLVELLKESDADIPKFLGYFKVETLDSLPAARFTDAKALLQQKINATKRPSAA